MVAPCESSGRRVYAAGCGCPFCDRYRARSRARNKQTMMPRLPTPPILELMERRYPMGENDHLWPGRSDAVEKVISRLKGRETIRLDVADNIACKYLDTHLALIYGADYFAGIQTEEPCPSP